MTTSRELTVKYENEIMDLLSPMFKKDMTPEEVTFFKCMVGGKLIMLKSEQSDIIVEIFTGEMK